MATKKSLPSALSIVASPAVKIDNVIDLDGTDEEFNGALALLSPGKAHVTYKDLGPFQVLPWNSTKLALAIARKLSIMDLSAELLGENKFTLLEVLDSEIDNGIRSADSAEALFERLWSVSSRRPL